MKKNCNIDLFQDWETITLIKFDVIYYKERRRLFFFFFYKYPGTRLNIFADICWNKSILTAFESLFYQRAVNELKNNSKLYDENM